ncbi:MAG: ArnT family glycosyltransferase [Planctomycetaceae bacterium]
MDLAAYSRRRFAGISLRWPFSPRASWLIGALLLIHLALGIDAARRLTVTHDEYWHLPAGLLGWIEGRFDYDNLNPPLTRLWAALPVVLTQSEGQTDAAPPPSGLDSLGHWLLAYAPADYTWNYSLARAMNLLWSLAAAVILALWSRQLFGERAACLTVALWTFCPNVLAHAALVTPDVGASCLFLATLYALWCYAQAPSWRGAGLFGILLGLAQLAKFTNLLLYPLSIVMLALARAARQPASAPSTIAPPPAAVSPPADGPTQRPIFAAGLGGMLWQVLAAWLLSLVVLNAGYFFDGSGRTLEFFRFQHFAPPALKTWFPAWRSIPILLPEQYVEGLAHQKQIMDSPHPVYLDGQWSTSGFTDYFVKALLYKLPHATQALLVLGALFALRSRGGRGTFSTQALLWLPVLALVAVASATGMQLGVRYLLPAFPFVMLLAGQCGRWLDWPRYRVRSAVVALFALALPLSLRYHPQHLAYFNELAGGPVGGRSHLLDSNLDWGQDLRELAQWLRTHQIDDVGLAYFGMLPPAELGINYHVPPRNPAPGWYAVSVNFVMGRPHTVRNSDGEMRSADFDEFGWFRYFQPTTRIGTSIDVYHITPDDLRNARRKAIQGP